MTRKTTILILTAALSATIALCGCGKDSDAQQPIIQLLSPDSLTVIPTEEQLRQYTPLPFCESDLVFADRLLLGMTPDSVREILGEPIAESTEEEGNSPYSVSTSMTYSGLDIRFYNVLNSIEEREMTDDLTLSDVVCRTNKVRFARGLHVGCPAKEVLASFAEDGNGEPLFLNDSLKANGRMIYGDSLGGSQHEDDNGYAYIDQSGLDSGKQKYYSINYCLEKQLVWFGSAEVDLCETYILRFFVDADTDTVTEIRLTHEAKPWVQTTHAPQ